MSLFHISVALVLANLLVWSLNNYGTLLGLTGSSIFGSPPSLFFIFFWMSPLSLSSYLFHGIRLILTFHSATESMMGYTQWRVWWDASRACFVSFRFPTSMSQTSVNLHMYQRIFFGHGCYSESCFLALYEELGSGAFLCHLGAHYCTPFSGCFFW